MRLPVLSYCFIVSLAISCKEKYDLPVNGPARGHLVVEGSINGGAGATTIKISRALGLVDTTTVRPERDAIVTVEGKDNSTATLAETSAGTYSIDQLSLLNSQQYRLHIKTKGGAEYYSAWVSPVKTPAIDGISWERINRGVELFVNTHDASGNVQYYRWEYEETWEFHSRYYSQLVYVPNHLTGNPRWVNSRSPDDANKLFYCWQSAKSTSILIGSTATLSKDSIHLPVHLIPNASWKLGVLYSILLKQYAISATEYEFLRRMKKNTEQVGSLFDAQPSELKGNIHNSKEPNELVIGFVSICTAEEKRIFIHASEVPGWGYYPTCELQKVPYTENEMTPFKFDIPIDIAEVGERGDTISINIALADCTDCTYRGTNIKPSFWP